MSISQTATIAAKIANLEWGQRVNQEAPIDVSAKAVPITKKAAVEMLNSVGPVQ